VLTLLAFSALVLSTGLVARGISLLFPHRGTRPAVIGGRRRDFFGDRIEGPAPVPVKPQPRPAPAAHPAVSAGARHAAPVELQRAA
jgi:hypothetical protein